MRLDAQQKKRVEENLGLVKKVIADKVHGTYEFGIYSREDLFQIGCVGLCKAAATDRGGCFSTYAYRLIWNEICDALIVSGRKWKWETPVSDLPEKENSGENMRPELQLVLKKTLLEAKKTVSESTRKGIRALLLMQQGYTSREIGEVMGAEAKLVCAWVSKARKYIRGRSELQQLAEGYGYQDESA